MKKFIILILNVILVALCFSGTNSFRLDAKTISELEQKHYQVMFQLQMKYLTIMYFQKWMRSIKKIKSIIGHISIKVLILYNR